ncbi:hypothetical protein V8G54_004087 [Vigna mungo]|uniref:Uncharacterized protein n=1 Tax=Vigna mungo TaxID=3915 RepID=A0AAQ3PC16_VIGMU
MFVPIMFHYFTWCLHKELQILLNWCGPNLGRFLNYQMNHIVVTLAYVMEDSLIIELLTIAEKLLIILKINETFPFFSNALFQITHISVSVDVELKLLPRNGPHNNEKKIREAKNHVKNIAVSDTILLDKSATPS